MVPFTEIAGLSDEERRDRVPVVVALAVESNRLHRRIEIGGLVDSTAVDRGASTARQDRPDPFAGQGLGHAGSNG